MEDKTCFYEPTALNQLSKEQLINEIDRLVKRIMQLELACELVVDKFKDKSYLIPEEDF